jgi:uncharacterized membrane protein YdjX (TVP38/TMEM64 family)
MGNVRYNRRLVLSAILVVTLIALVIIFGEPIRTNLLAFQDWARGAGALGVTLYILLYVLATVAFLPGWILSVGAGLIYGVVAGTAIISLASTAGATLAFLLARSFLRRSIENKLQGNARFDAIDRAIGNSGWKIVLLLRLSPIFPFNLLNYALGLTRIPAVHYILASWIGMLPGTALYVYLGSLGKFFAAERERTTAEKIMFVAGLAATALVTALITKISRDALRKQIISPHGEK